MGFEDRVRRVAEAIWRLEPGEVQPEWYRGDPILHELDGIARLPDMTHVMMITVSTKLKKVEEDVAKLNKAERKEKGRGVPCRQWLITEQQLNAEHIDHARKHGVELLTFSQFRDRFFNGRDYVAKRRGGAFGSARNLRDGSISVPDDEYVELPMMAVSSETLLLHKEHASSEADLNDIVKRISRGERLCLLGPFGAGKSLTAREVFMRLAKLQTNASESTTPIYLNLREHWGAVYGDEILERHARSIGFTPRETLTVAWRAGICHLILDGIDEVATQVIARPSDKSFMKRTRYEALQAVRDLIMKAPQGVGILVCGRDHYFDGIQELRHALGLTSKPFTVVTLGEFTDEKVKEFLEKHAASTRLPDWLPRKPLLLGYLAHQGLLDKVISIDASRGFGFAWDSFLRLVCDREAEHERAVMDPTTIRHVLERLACVARNSVSGSGPIAGPDLAEVYRAETGEMPGEGVLMQLQRLPGLTPREQDPTARSFVDPDLLSALQGSALARVVLENVQGLADRKWLAGLTRNGLRMAAHILERHMVTSGAVLDVAIRTLRESAGRPEVSQLIADLFMIAAELNGENTNLDGRNTIIADGSISELNLEDRYLENVTFRNCTFDDIYLGEGTNHSICKFEECAISRVHGVPSEAGLPAGMFSGCVIDEFDNATTNAAILRLNVEPGLKALMTVLRKLYLQAGGGRRLEALKRGIPGGGPVHSAVDRIMRLLEIEGLVVITKTGGDVAHPVRKYASRVQQILSSGPLSKDKLVEQARLIN